MKQFLTGLISLFTALGGHAQTLETGLAINASHLYKSEFGDYVHNRTDGFGISLMARYQNPNATYLVLKNNEVGLEFCRGQIEVQAEGRGGSPTGATASINYTTSSLSLNNYFVNFGSLDKGFQVALGLHCNYKIITLSEGFSEEYNIAWVSTPWGSGYRHWYTKNSLDGINNQLIERFNLGPTVGIAFKPFEVGKFKLRCRYDINASLLGELKENTNFDYLRQRITLSVVLGKQH